jgi:GalNAc-alpha-(1->4)-GalNAc-alpha-(1->3)-diNAcBac-PP-undecaprenol alpha-1,4-N-acetyl-D-galactosaminyltransferase
VGKLLPSRTESREQYLKSGDGGGSISDGASGQWHPSPRHSSARTARNMTEGRSYSSKIAVVCNTTRCGGIYRVVSTLCNTWSRQERQVYLIALYGYESFFHLERSVHRIDAAASHETNGVERIRRKAENLLARFLLGLKQYYPERSSERLLLKAGSLWLSARVRPLRAAIQHSGAPLVIAFGWQANILAILACRKLGCKVVISERNDVALQRLEYPWEDLRCGLYQYADVVTANTRGALKTMQAYVPEEKLAFIPNPAVHHEAGDDTPHPSSFEAAVILTVANLERRKAHDILLEAFARLSPKLSNWRLAIVGGGEEEITLRKQAKALGIAERLDWYGQVANPVVFYRKASIFVLPSRYEGLPNALMEAMSYGLPAIVSNASSGPLELIKDGETGLVVPVGDPFALADAIALLGNASTLRKRLGDAGRKRVSEYDLSRVMSLWERIIATGHSANLQDAASTNTL